MRRWWTMLAAAIALAAPVQAWPDSWRAPIPPFHIVGNIYYVGTQGLAAYLIVGSQGSVLIDATLPETAQQVEANVAALGFHLKQVKLILNTHAHFDHAGGMALLKRDTGAAVYASRADTPTLESGHNTVENSNGLLDFPPVRVDRAVHDGATVRLGEIALHATLTPGHTPGCTSWSMTTIDRGRRLRVLFPCSLTTAGNRLIGNRSYPRIVRDYRHSFAVLGRMKADVVLTAHPEIGDVIGRAARRHGDDAGAFIDRNLLPKIVADARRAFDADLAAEKAHPTSRS